MRKWRSLTDEQIERIQSLYRLRWPSRKIAAELGTNQGTVLDVLREFNVAVRRTRFQTDLERFEEEAIPEPNTGCWMWMGWCNKHGYGYSHRRNPDGSFTTTKAYRIAYELFVGPIPAGYEIDHKCRNKWCVNPDHLEAVTKLENQLRAPNSLINRMLRGEKMGVHAKRSIDKALQRDSLSSEQNDRGSEDDR